MSCVDDDDNNNQTEPPGNVRTTVLVPIFGSRITDYCPLYHPKFNGTINSINIGGKMWYCTMTKTFVHKISVKKIGNIPRIKMLLMNISLVLNLHKKSTKKKF